MPSSGALRRQGRQRIRRSRCLQPGRSTPITGTPRPWGWTFRGAGDFPGSACRGGQVRLCSHRRSSFGSTNHARRSVLPGRTVSSCSAKAVGHLVRRFGPVLFRSRPGHSQETSINEGNALDLAAGVPGPAWASALKPPRSPSPLATSILAVASAAVRRTA